jgi:protein-disulfide isomerase
MQRFILALLLAAASLGVSGCAPAADEAKTTSNPPSSKPADGSKSADSAKTGTVATVDGAPITLAQLEEHVSAKLVEIDNQRYEVLSEGLDELIADTLFDKEAQARGMAKPALAQAEITAKIAAPSDAEVQEVYDANKEQLQGQTLEQIKPRIVEYLKSQKAEARRQAYIGELKQKYKTTVALKPPVIEVETAGRPEKGGGANAPVTIVYFSDYECPYCGRAENVVDQVMKTYGDKIRLVFRDYPLPFHANARPAAEAASCANAQGKFWEYHAKLFQHQNQLGADKLTEYADQVGLDKAKFADCMAKKPYTAAIDKDMADGAKVGVNGTPAFFINGRMLSGAQPFDKFKEIIDDELAAKG